VPIEVVKNKTWPKVQIRQENSDKKRQKQEKDRIISIKRENVFIQQYYEGVRVGINIEKNKRQ
jgi:hypothetical protein